MSDHPSLNFQIFIKPKHPKLASGPVLARQAAGAVEDEHCGLMDNAVSTAAGSDAAGNYYTILRLNPDPGPSDASQMVN